MTSTVAHRQPQTPSGLWARARRCLQWLLIGLLALDLIGSPLHAHHHDGEWSPGSTLPVALDAPELAAQTHAEQPDGPAFGHSISALRTSSLELAGAALAQLVLAPLPPLMPQVPDVADGPAASRDWAESPPGIHRSLPPDGRAPPQQG